MPKGFTKTGYAGAALLAGALVVLFLVVALFRHDQDTYQALSDRADRIHQVIDTAPAALSALKDAETGQRGFLLTGKSDYLTPYSTGIHEFRQLMPILRGMTAGDAAAAEYVRQIGISGETKLDELAGTISLYNEGRKSDAIDRVNTDLGKRAMDDARAATAGLTALEEQQFTRANLATAEAVRQTRNRFFIDSFLLSIFMIIGTILLIFQMRSERRLLSTVERSEQRYRELAEHLEEEVADRTRHLEDVNRSLNAFSYSVSHDLRAPLRSIDGFSLMVMEDYADRIDDAGRDMLRRIRAAATRMGLLIQSLLELSRVTASELTLETVGLSSMAEGIVDGLRSAAPERKVEVSIQPNLETSADPNLMRVVLDNLLSNAWKFTAKKNPAKIDVGRTGVSGAFYVKDNGAGFDPARTDRLFTPFQRLHSASEFEGTGIGLATVHRAIQRHGGRIWAESTPDEGTTFFFTLEGAR